MDVSTVKELARRWYPGGLAGAPAKAGGHRAMDDIRESVAELAYYRSGRLPGPARSPTRRPTHRRHDRARARITMSDTGDTAPEEAAAADSRRRPSREEALATLTAPGQLFEMEELDIRGVPTRIWKNAPATLRTVLELSSLHGDQDFLVYEDERTPSPSTSASWPPWARP